MQLLDCDGMSLNSLRSIIEFGRIIIMIQKMHYRLRDSKKLLKVAC